MINGNVKSLVSAFNDINKKTCVAIKATELFLDNEQYKEGVISIREVKILLRALSMTIEDIESTIHDEKLA